MKALLGLLGTLVAAAIICAGPAVWWYDRRPADAPPLLHFKVLFWSVNWPGKSLGGQLADLKAQEAAAGKRSVRIVKAQTAITHQAEAKEQVAQDHIRVVTRTLIKEIPGAIPSSVDRGFPLSVGWVRFHDAAALGLDLSAAAGPPGLADDVASPVKSSDAAATIAGNYGACHETAERLTALQDWVRQVTAVSSSP